MLIHKFVVPITLTLLVSLVMVKCQGFGFKTSINVAPSSRSIQIEFLLFNKCSKGCILLEGKKVTAAPGPSSSKLVLTSVGMGSTLTIHSNGTFLCFNKGGRLVNKRWRIRRNRRNRRKSLCEFREILRDNYSTFQSVFNSNWYIGFNRLGQPIRGGRKVRDRKWSSYMFQKRELADKQRHDYHGIFASVPPEQWAKHIDITDAS